MIETTLSKVGNSMAVLLPKALRSEACFEPDEPLRLDSPRKGVVVITALHSDGEDRLARLERAESRIKSREDRLKPWPEGKTAEDLISEGKDAHNSEFLSF